MKVHVFAVSQKTGKQEHTGIETLSDAVDEETLEEVQERIAMTGEAYVGGGAAQLFRLVPVEDVGA